MPQFSFARILLEHWGVYVQDIPTSDADEKKEADFFAKFGDAAVLIEEKTKEDDLNSLSARANKLAQGNIHTVTLPLVRNETLSGIVKNASDQLKSSSNIPHDFRLVWFTATGMYAQGKYEQFIATLYGSTNILEMNARGYRRCYYFRNADFYRRSEVIDGAIAAYTDGKSIVAKLCLNALSPRYQALKDSAVAKQFGDAIEDPIRLETAGSAFIVDCNLSRKEDGPLLAYLQAKYKTAPLMQFDLGYTDASLLVPKDKA